jgi:hypothetical protein
VGVHKNCWGPSNLNLLGLGQPHLGQMYHLVMVIHSLGGSRTNRHHMSNPQSGAAQPTQDEDPQATRNPLELPFALSQSQ